jgi:hypothetical protein
MLPELILEAVSERDVDLLILEEMSVNRTFIEALALQLVHGQRCTHWMMDTVFGLSYQSKIE